MIRVEITGVNEVNTMLHKLPTELNTQLSKAGDEFMAFVRKSARIRAPHMTGELAKSIIISKPRKGTILLEVTSPYGIFQEEGYRGHFVNSSMSTRNALGTIGVAYGLPKNVSLLIPSQSGRFFIRNALAQGLRNLPSMLQGKAKSAINKSRGKR